MQSELETVFQTICEGCTTHECCNDCKGSNGFFIPIPENFQGLKDFFGWNAKGFLGAEGCLLPFALRSEMCRTWICEARRTPEAEVLVRDNNIKTTG